MNKEEMINYVKSLGGIETPEGWNVPTSVKLGSQNLTKIPIQFNIVKGNFYCHYNKLTSLKGCPKEVTGTFHCSINQLTSLKYCPKIVYRHFSCTDNQLNSLKYSPKIVNGNFWCSNNKLTSLKYCPETVEGYFICDKGEFTGKDYYKFLLKEKVITETEYLLYII